MKLMLSVIGALLVSSAAIAADQPVASSHLAPKDVPAPAVTPAKPVAPAEPVSLETMLEKLSRMEDACMPRKDADASKAWR